MSTEIVPSVVDINNDTELSTTIALPAIIDPALNESGLTPDLPTDANTLNITNVGNVLLSESGVFETFVVIEIIMTTLEVIISILAAIKMPRWRRNYRNQMLMQLTFARFIKRIIFTIKFLEDRGKITPTDIVANIINCFQIYIDFVIVILVCFFIKHMYSSLIIVLVNISQNNLYRVLGCSWLIPVPISAACTTVIVTKVVEEWHVYLFMCSLFRWPLIFLGTGTYVTIVYRVLTDRKRQFARSLTVVTFLLCLSVNFYLFSKDIIELWCLKSFTTLLISYISGFLMNLLILILYVILLILTYNNRTQSSRSFPDYSLADVNVKTLSLTATKI